MKMPLRSPIRFLLAPALCCFLAQVALAAAPGHLYLVSVGVGDPDNITLRAQKVLQSADIVFAMRGDANVFKNLLKGKEIHEDMRGLFRDGGHEGKPAADQGRADAMRKLIYDAVTDGKTIAIIEHGDPTLFGPQMSLMREFQDLGPIIIPGISSFNAANAVLGQGVLGGQGRTLTLASSYGLQEYGDSLGLKVPSDPRDGLVLFTMRSDLPRTAANLRKRYPADTPIAIVLYAGDTLRQKVIRGTLADIVNRVGSEKLPFEHLIYVGACLK